MFSIFLKTSSVINELVRFIKIKNLNTLFICIVMMMRTICICLRSLMGAVTISTGNQPKINVISITQVICEVVPKLVIDDDASYITHIHIFEWSKTVELSYAQQK